MVPANGDERFEKMEMKLHRAEWPKIAGVIIAAIGLAVTVAVGIMMHVFQTRQDAITEHAAINQEIKVKEAEHAGELKAQDTFNTGIVKRLDAQGKVLINVQKNLERQMWEERRRDSSRPRPRPLPSSLDMSDVIGDETE